MSDPLDLPAIRKALAEAPHETWGIGCSVSGQGYSMEIVRSPDCRRLGEFGTHFMRDGVPDCYLDLAHGANDRAAARARLIVLLRNHAEALLRIAEAAREIEKRAEAAEARVAALEEAADHFQALVGPCRNMPCECGWDAAREKLRALLAPAETECGTCGGSGKVLVAVYDGAGLKDTDSEPCKTCGGSGVTDFHWAEEVALSSESCPKCRKDGKV